MKVYLKKIDGLTIPKQGSESAAGYDIVATSDPIIVGKQIGNHWRSIDFIEYKTNVFIAPASVTSHVLIHPRSSIRKYNLILKNSIGLADADYRGEYLCSFHYIFQPEDLHIDVGDSGLVGSVNFGKIYKKGDKIAQLVFEPTTHVDFEIVDDLSDTNRGKSGFGSTGS